MMRGRSGFPKKEERLLKKQLKEKTRLIEELLKDSTGATVIAALEEKVRVLEEKAGDAQALKVKNANLSATCSTLKEQHAKDKREIAALKLDLKVAYSFSNDLEHRLKKTEQKRFEWAMAARKLEGALKEAKEENRRLKACLNRTPENSSLPPSSSPIKKIHNSRTKTGRKPGGQPGHAGHRRKQHAPDKTVVIASPGACPTCGGALGIAGKQKKRKVTDLHITVVTTEYVAHDHVCTKCKMPVVADFPKDVINEQNYGNNVRAVAAYLVNRCNMSIDNTTAFLYEASGHALRLSKGSVHNFLKAFSEAAKDDIFDIKDLIRASSVIGCDATHTTCAGKRSYIYSYNCQDAALYEASAKKGIAPLLSSVIDGYGGTIVHDHDTAYYRFGARHAECNVHILRYLKGVKENEPERTWAGAMYALLCEANDLAKRARHKGDANLAPEKIAEVESNYDAICFLAESEYRKGAPYHPKYRPEGMALAARLREHRVNHLAFLHDLSIPFDNNASERLLRGAKKKVKQSGGFRSLEHGQEPYCDFLTVTQTASMQGMETLGVVRAIFDGIQGTFKKVEANNPAAGP